MSETVRLLAGLLYSHTPSLLLLPLIISHALTLPSQPASSSHSFHFDYLSPYPQGRHGSKRTVREISNCQHTMWQNRTFETFKVSTEPPISQEVSYQLHKFADITQRPVGPQYLVGTIAYIEQPYHTFSVLEPGGEGGCSGSYFATRSTVRDTVNTRKGGCKLAANAGYFVVVSGKCLGNVVSDRRLVQTAGDEQNANFGIREDGTIVVGYIPDEEILNTTNPFRQLVTGVVWLVRNGTNYVNESKRMECADHEDTGRMDTFVDVVSARTALGHDAQGRLVMVQIEGQTHHRGANLIEFADLLVRHGVVNAVNLDGGGSNTLLANDVLINYPSDHCSGAGQYRCARAVSTALCVHDVQCLDPECRGHGVCEGTQCSCEPEWTGTTCDTLNCSATDCSGHGNCTDGKCKCDAGWNGDLCDKACSSSRYGPDCRQYCWCYGNSHCHPITGQCVCPPGFTGYTCMQECAEGRYGPGCQQECVYPHCSGHGLCSTLNGTCLCREGWKGPSCNISVVSEEEEETSGSGELSPSPPSPSPPPPPPPSITSTAPSASIQHLNSSGNTHNDMCENCSRLCSVEGVNCSSKGARKDCKNTTQSVLIKDDGAIVQWSIGISLLISLLTLLIHILFCYMTHRWPFRSRAAAMSHVLPANTEAVSLSGTKKRLKRRKPRPKFRTPLMLHYSSSTDCSL